ncbi:MAG: AbrB/MazE/SpoVT family DNA-binding domain-containing protein [Thermoplasmatota archaeon]
MVEKRILNDGRIVIPKDIRDQLDIHEGNKVQIEIDGNKITISKQSCISERLKSIAEEHDSKVNIKKIKRSIKNRFEVQSKDSDPYYI